MAWLADWPNRISHNLTAASGAGTNYQKMVRVHSGAGENSGIDVYLGGRCTDFPNDIRFTDDDGETKLAHWCEDLTADPAIFHVKVADDLGSNQSIYIYCGKSGATSASNGLNTFIRFDDFDRDAEEKLVLASGYYTGDVIKLANGDLLWAMAGGGDTRVYRSQDDGDNWSLLSTPRAYYCGDVKICLLANGDVMLCFTYGGDIVGAISEDSGATWGSNFGIRTDGENWESNCVQLANGDILVACVDKTNKKTYIRVSHDGGDTWDDLSNVSWAYWPEDTNIFQSSDGIVFLEQEEEIAEGGASLLCMYRSEDNGASWGSKITIVANDGYDNEGGAFVQISSGEIWFIYSTDVDAEGGSYGASKIKVKKSEDDGESWAALGTIRRWLGAVELSATKTDDDHILVIWGTYAWKSPYENQQLKFDLDSDLYDATDYIWSLQDIHQATAQVHSGSHSMSLGAVKYKSNSIGSQTLGTVSLIQWVYVPSTEAGNRATMHTYDSNNVLYQGAWIQFNEGNVWYYDGDWVDSGLDYIVGWNKVEIIHTDSTHFDLCVNGNWAYGCTVETAMSNVDKFGHSDTSLVATYYADDFCVRKYVDPEPGDGAWGSWETLGQPTMHRWGGSILPIGAQRIGKGW